jgi:hypothetical protein
MISVSLALLMTSAFGMGGGIRMSSSVAFGTWNPVEESEKILVKQAE